MSELDDLERDFLETANVWFAQSLHLKLQRLIAIARNGERAMAQVNAIAVSLPRLREFNPPSVPVRREPTIADPLPPLPTVICENGE
jgi:hypothetical protein